MDWNEVIENRYPDLMDLDYIDDVDFRKDLGYDTSNDDIPGFEYRQCRVQCMNGQCGIAEISNNEAYKRHSKKIDEVIKIIGYTVVVISGENEIKDFETIDIFVNKRTNNTIKLQSKKICAE